MNELESRIRVYDFHGKRIYEFEVSPTQDGWAVMFVAHGYWCRYLISSDRIAQEGEINVSVKVSQLK